MRCSVAFIVAPYGFGPSSKAVAISSYLPRSVDRVFVGQGPPLEMARQSDEFSACVPLNFHNGAGDASALLAGFDVLIFVNSTRFISASLISGRPAILVETLAWLRDEPPPGAPMLCAFFAQRFLDHPFCPALEAMANFFAIGPIVPKGLSAAQRNVRTPGPVRSPILHCGGLFSPVMVHGAAETFVTHALGAAGQFNGTMRALLPLHLHEAVPTSLERKIHLVESSSLSVHEQLVGSEFALTTTGIEFTYESMLLGVPTIFLPPFNASQHFQARHHARTCSDSVPFEFGGEAPSEFEALHDATTTLQHAGMDGRWPTQFAAVSNFLERFTPEERGPFLSRLQARQRSMIGCMGADGAQAVAARILREVGAELALL